MGRGQERKDGVSWGRRGSESNDTEREGTKCRRMDEDKKNAGEWDNVEAEMMLGYQTTAVTMAPRWARGATQTKLVRSKAKDDGFMRSMYTGIHAAQRIQ